MPNTLETRIGVLRLALPIIAANIATPLVGWVDTAVVGQLGDLTLLAALALGTLIFNALYWSFGFLRMSATALSAQADGRGDPQEVQHHLWRGLILGALIGVSFMLLSPFIITLALNAFSSGPELDALTQSYFYARIFGAPAALAGFALQGWLIGMGRTRAVFLIQLALNLTNGVLSIALAMGLNWGLVGVGVATALSQYVALAVGLSCVRDQGLPLSFASIGKLIEIKALKGYFGLNRDIFLRTLALLAGFYWFNEASLRAGTEVLAGNAILLQFITLSAMFLDAFAYLTEGAVGRAVGKGERAHFYRVLYLTSEQALVFALGLAAAFWIAGPSLIGFMTQDPIAQQAALTYLPYCCLALIIGLPSWQLDGVMIGATRGGLMRNAMIAAFIGYLALDMILRPAFGGHGLWLAFWGYYALRAMTLMVGWPGLMRQFQSTTSTPTASDS